MKEKGWLAEVIAYLKGEMDGEEKEAFERDLARSPERRALLEENREVLDLLEAANEERIIDIVHLEMIRKAIDEGASDIHVVPVRHVEGAEGGGMVLFLRINGQLREVARYPRELHIPVVNRWKVMSECSLNERRVPQEGRIGVTRTQKDYDLRVTILPTLVGERVSARLLARTDMPADLDTLGLSPAQVESVRRLIP
jgi:type II secretory ATPase GspE/PulE/Tfp pilus assembly ATPase PilB-like protein